MRINWNYVAVFLVLLGSLLWCIHLYSEAKICAGKGGYYAANAYPLPACLKSEVIK